MALKPWYHVVYPREDLREGKPLDAAEFAVHLKRLQLRLSHNLTRQHLPHPKPSN